MIKIERREDCSGCTACASICPVDAITMRPDSEGFQYPKVNEKKCIECHLCERVCPIANRKMEQTKQQDAYLFQLKNKTLRMESTSGGAFTAIAAQFIREGGVVYGAAYDEDLQVIHMRVDSIEDLRKFRNSKYVQSNLGNVFREIRDLLKGNQKVCFSGTPCQVEGIKSFLGKLCITDNLLLVDFVCHAVPSPLFWWKYVHWQEKKLSVKIGNVRFRDKRHYGYKYSQMVITDENGGERYHQGVESDPYLRAFFSNLSDRPSCYSCAFKKRYRESDITLWDCFDVGLKAKTLDDDLGTTNILVQSERGAEWIAKLTDDIIMIPIDADICVAGMRELVCSVPYTEKRAAFMKDVADKDMQEIIDIWLPNNFKIKLKKFLRRALIRLDIYDSMKKKLMKMRINNSFDNKHS
ncbi:Coenzyme F420 hydrogenase/dehydrogenase, beta subunit C-terminal domain [Mitsuokella jalaludinii]|uniref:Coenzyme F420 hydrogenase/dehydrogenase, beta subunit C-terminal domain n=1 Tax=Mitsuokella jalaludinii TaxID=187979 RepID=UPI0020D10A1A|nr:Coenzyme F420 hydrogenase/dehydrogenase, beta subunit C-terminal domain [Mitsuokella jalaludinii]MCQ1533890.1 Coenzyme F420 hydrogenase/dehydrogenase, beta subunit C-terminal domain [Mitsuokella jalaludinii]